MVLVLVWEVGSTKQSNQYVLQQHEEVDASTAEGMEQRVTEMITDLMAPSDTPQVPSLCPGELLKDIIHHGDVLSEELKLLSGGSKYDLSVTEFDEQQEARGWKIESIGLPDRPNTVTSAIAGPMDGFNNIQFLSLGEIVDDEDSQDDSDKKNTKGKKGKPTPSEKDVTRGDLPEDLWYPEVTELQLEAPFFESDAEKTEDFLEDFSKDGDDNEIKKVKKEIRKK